MKTIKYIGFYIKDKNNYRRNGSIAATNKMDYISNAINNAGYKVNIISPSWFSERREGYTKGYTNVESEVKSVTFAPSYNASNRVLIRIRAIFSYIWLFMYLLKNTEKGEDIILYHSLYLINPVLLAKKIKKFNLILEINEIYCDVMKYRKLVQKREKKIFLSANKYIFSTELLNQKLNKDNKPFVINYGTYGVEEDRKYKFNDEKIHIVYAGIIDSEKGGATTTVKCAKFFDSNYHVHIIGFGSEKRKKELFELIEKVSKVTDCKLTYDGLLQGEEYIQFLQKCDIGLSAQTPNGAYNDTSFPSKVLSYLANGLRVVSIRIKVVEYSKVGEMVYFYDDNKPEEVANAIKKINFSDVYDSRKKIKELDNLFIVEIKNMIC